MSCRLCEFLKRNTILYEYQFVLRVSKLERPNQLSTNEPTDPQREALQNTVPARRW